MSANAYLVSFSGALPAISMKQWRPMLGFFLKHNHFAYGEKFFTDPGER
jgi:hypothetical protein